MAFVPEWKRRQRAARGRRTERIGLSLGRILLAIAAACAAATVAPGGPRTVEVTVKRDWSSGWSDIQKLLRSKSQPKYIAESVRPDMYPRSGDRDPIDVMVRRTQALLASVARLPPGADLTKLRRELGELKEKADFARSAGEKLLVEGVIKSKCDACHRQKARSVRIDASRARRLVPHYISPKPFEPSRTVPGKFSALGSKLLKYLDKSHHSVKLTGEESHRLTLWMDCNLATTGPERLTEEQRSRLVEFAPPADTRAMADELTSRR